MRRLTFGLALAAMPLGFAPAPLPRPGPAGPLGTGEVVAETAGGRPAKTPGLVTVVITRDQLVATLDGKLVRRFRLRFDDRARPATLDMDGQGEATGRRYLCLYELRGT